MSCIIHRWTVVLRLLLLVLLIATLPVPLARAMASRATLVAEPIDQALTGALNPTAATTMPQLTARMATLNGLVEQAELIVRGRVTKVESGWHADQRLIESTVTIATAYTLLGNAGPTVTVHTPGGYLATEGIGMVSMHAADFVAGEEVLLFLHQSAQRWQMVNGAAGKFLVQGNYAINRDVALVESVDGLLVTVATLSANRDTTPGIARIWRHAAPNSQPLPMRATQTQAGVPKWATPHATATFYLNVNSRQMNGQSTDSSDLRNAIIAAANQWNTVASADFSLRYGGPTAVTTTGYDGVNAILFMRKGPKERAAAAEVWYTADRTIVEADIWINDDYQWDTSGQPAANAVDLQSALLHEFGHWLILGHIAQTEAIMFPRLAAGTVKRALHAEDIAGISAIYPR